MIIIQFQMLINHLFQNCEPNNDLNYVGPGVCSELGAWVERNIAAATTNIRLAATALAL